MDRPRTQPRDTMSITNNDWNLVNKIVYRHDAAGECVSKSLNKVEIKMQLLFVEHWAEPFEIHSFRDGIKMELQMSFHLQLIAEICAKSVNFESIEFGKEFQTGLNVMLNQPIRNRIETKITLK